MREMNGKSVQHKLAIKYKDKYERQLHEERVQREIKRDPLRFLQCAERMPDDL